MVALCAKGTRTHISHGLSCVVDGVTDGPVFHAEIDQGVSVCPGELDLRLGDSVEDLFPPLPSSLDEAQMAEIAVFADPAGGPLDFRLRAFGFDDKAEVVPSIHLEPGQGAYVARIPHQAGNILFETWDDAGYIMFRIAIQYIWKRLRKLERDALRKRVDPEKRDVSFALGVEPQQALTPVTLQHC